MSLVSILFLLISVIAFSLLVWVFRLWRETKSITALLIMVPLSFLWFDSLTMGIGTLIGEGSLLKGMSYFRYTTHYIGLPAWIIAAVFLARDAEFAWARSPLVLIGAIALAAFFVISDLYQFWGDEMYAACILGTLRYVTQVAPDQACHPEEAGLGEGIGPAAPITVIVIFLVVGTLLWIKKGWPWLTVGSLVMFILAGVPQSIAGPIFSNTGELFISAALIYTAQRFIPSHD